MPLSDNIERKMFHLNQNQYTRILLCLNIQKYFNVIIGLSLKVMWQCCLKNKMLTLKKQQQNIGTLKQVFESF